jgi:hypothetical protein
VGVEWSPVLVVLFTAAIAYAARTHLLWALNGRDDVDFERWMRLDMEHIDNWSLGLDWKILVQTIPHVLSGR